MAGRNEDHEEEENEVEDIQNNQHVEPPPPQEPNILLGGVPFRNGGLGAAHQALLQREGPAGYVPYLRPPLFYLRIFLLLVVMCISLSLASTLFLTLPGISSIASCVSSVTQRHCFCVAVWIGRRLMETFYGDGPHHELYTAFAGLYFCWLVLRGVHVFSNLAPKGWSNFFNRLKSYTILVNTVVHHSRLVAV